MTIEDLIREYTLKCTDIQTEILAIISFSDKQREAARERRDREIREGCSSYHKKLQELYQKKYSLTAEKESLSSLVPGYKEMFQDVSTNLSIVSDEISDTKKDFAQFEDSIKKSYREFEQRLSVETELKLRTKSNIIGIYKQNMKQQIHDINAKGGEE
jgi:predicted  nucleic acid-binding Zn-ribbon protein